MKKVATVGLCFFMLFVIIGCSNKNASVEKNKATTSTSVNKKGTVIQGINWGDIDKNTESELTVALSFLTHDTGIGGPMSPNHLIDQLSANGGQGWTKEEANRIVQMIVPKVDWNKIAVYAARNERKTYGVVGQAIIPKLTAKQSYDPDTGNNYSNYGFSESQAEYALKHIDDKKYPDINN